MDLSDARILLSNDDGIQSTGFAVLERVANALTDDVWVCAPESEQSGASHSLTLHRPLRLRAQGPRRYTVDGTPTDCVLLAINRLFADRRPTLMLSGVNHGQNIAEDVTYSGTIAAAMEATLLGVRAIAFSQCFVPDRAPDWRTAEHWAPQVIVKIMAIDWPANVLINVNFPACGPEEVAGIDVVPHANRKVGDISEERIDPRGRTYYWIGAALPGEETPPGTDAAALSENRIAITPIQLDLTHYATIDALKAAVA